MDKIAMFLQLLGAISAVCTALSALLPAGKSKDIISSIGIDVAKMVGK